MVDTWNDPYNLVQRTNWQKELFGNGITSNMDVSLTGGSAKSSFMISAGVYDEKGIIKNSYFIDGLMYIIV